jgi:hypothetical protein
MDQYLIDRVLQPMRIEERRLFCIEDTHMRIFFGSLLYNKPRSQEIANCVRGYANLMTRYLLPLRAEHGWVTTEDIFIMKNGEVLRVALMTIGKIDAFYEDTDQFIANLENGAVIKFGLNLPDLIGLFSEWLQFCPVFKNALSHAQGNHQVDCQFSFGEIWCYQRQVQ